VHWATWRAMSARRYMLANAGDSRAVLCRKGEAVPLSRDHKPMDEDERDRIQKVGRCRLTPT